MDALPVAALGCSSALQRRLYRSISDRFEGALGSLVNPSLMTKFGLGAKRKCLLRLVAEEPFDRHFEVDVLGQGAAEECWAGGVMTLRALGDRGGSGLRRAPERRWS